ncbi:MAG: sigma-70 family RNA polymerase sigma factor [Acidobacteriota bacterium]
MAATRRGDLEAFGSIVDRYKDPLVNYLTRLAGCRQRAEDLAQDSFLRLFESARRYEERGCLKALLYRIAVNRLRSEERRFRRWRGIEPMYGASANGHTPEAGDLLRDELQHQVQGAIADLPLKFRIPLVLHELEDWPYDAIADQLGCRVGTVKSRIFRARERLRRRLEPYWNGEAR